MGKLQIGRSYNNNLRVGGKFPLDDREVVEYIADLTNVNTWLTETEFNAAYEGMKVYVLENEHEYVLTNRDGNVTATNAWRDNTELINNKAEAVTINVDFSKYVTQGLNPFVNNVTPEDVEEFNKLVYLDNVGAVTNSYNYSNLQYISGRNGSGFVLQETFTSGDGYIYRYDAFPEELTINKISSNVRSFTQAEWDALTTAQQNSYTLAIVT